LSSGEKKRFRKFCEEYLSTEKDNFLRIAADRFKSAYERHNVEDQLIDFVIAFEALFLRHEAGLRSKLSQRVALYSDDNPMKRARLFKLVRDAYDIRSNLVHGGRKSKIEKILKKRDMNLAAFVIEIEDLLRKCIKQYMRENRMGIEKEEIIERLDLLSLGFDFQIT